MSCKTPYLVNTKDLTKPTVPVPCGKCPECLARMASSWSFRLLQEDKKADRSAFITLTYSPDALEAIEECKTRNGFLSLRKRHIQLFFKSLRKAHDVERKSIKTPHRINYKPIKYFAVGEYGTQNSRPHYHIILFNADIKHIQHAWKRGDVHYGSVSGASVGYCLKYMCKRPSVPKHERDDRQKEFRLMSKDLGHAISLPI